MEYRYPIRVVAKRTGISPHLIRMWERRYGAVKPARTDTGRRLYSDEDIERLSLLRMATHEGQTISQIALYSADQLRALIPGDNSNLTENSIYDNNSVEYHLNLCLQAIKNLDAVELESRLMRASIGLGQRVFIEKLLHPLLELTGEMWSDGRLSVSHEHLASAVIRSLLGSMYLSNTAGESSPLLISATPSGQQHEFGALMALVTAASMGWRTLYLGPNLPAEDIAEAANNRNADAIALSIVYPSDDPRVGGELRKIAQMTVSQIPLIVGGRSAVAYDNILDEIGAIRIGGLVELRRELDRIKKGTQSPALN